MIVQLVLLLPSLELLTRESLMLGGPLQEEQKGQVLV